MVSRGLEARRRSSSRVRTVPRGSRVATRASSVPPRSTGSSGLEWQASCTSIRVPSGNLERNGLSHHIANFVKVGRSRGGMFGHEPCRSVPLGDLVHHSRLNLDRFLVDQPQELYLAAARRVARGPSPFGSAIAAAVRTRWESPRGRLSPGRESGNAPEIDRHRDAGGNPPC